MVESDNISTSSLGLTKVVLYKHGIGYFERRGKADGPTKIDLVCEASEIDDMLKSLLALTTKGRVDAVTYDSSKTLQSRLAEFGFDISKVAGLSGLLAQMKGIPVTVTASSETFCGRMLGLDLIEHRVNDQVMREEQLTLYTADSSFKRIAVSSISGIKVDDENMAAELKQQLELLFQNAKKKDRKALSVVLSEPGEQDVLIAYSIPCPIWKTSYRLVMQEQAKIMLQGMAIVDNLQEEDWTEVEVVLVSASPISFIQPLYDPVQPQRTRIAAQGNSSSGPVVAERARRPAMPQAPAQPAPASMMMKARMASAESSGWDAAGAGAFTGDAFMEADSSFQSQAAPVGQMFANSSPLEISTSQTGELFEYRISKPVTIPRNSSALLPIVQQDIEGERISLFNESKNTKFPHAAVRFVNNTGLTLEAGPVTVMEGDIYAGEALLDTTKPDDKRFLLYAIDQACPTVVRNQSISRPHWRVRSFSGMIYMDHRICNERYYDIENLSEHAKTIYVEHPLRQGWNIVSELAPVETTDNYYRFKLELIAKSSTRLIVAEESETFEQIYIYDPGNLDTNRLDWICGQNFADAEFIKFVKRLLAKRVEMQAIQAELAQQQQIVKQSSDDQSRARENLRTLGSNNERYRKAIDVAEDQISETNKKIQSLTRQLIQLQKEYQEIAMLRLVSELNAVSASKTAD